MASRVVIAGGGIAGIEAALGVRELAPEGCELVVVSPAADLWHQDLTRAPLALGGVTRVPMGRVCEELGADLVADRMTAVDPDTRRVALADGEPLAYDELLVAVGARRATAQEGAVLYGSTVDAGTVERIVAGARAGEVGRVAIVVPPAVAWSLPAYEVALTVAAAGAQAVVVTPEDVPAVAFGEAAGAVAEALAAAGVVVVRGRAADIETGAVVMRDEQRIEADAIVALPWVHGPRTEGLPHDPDGFLPTDPWGGVDGVEHVFGAGDGTTFPVRQGGVACQQAATAAHELARRLGADLPREPLKPVVRGALPTADGTLWLEHDLATGVARASREPLWDPPHRVAGVRLPAFVERLARA